MKKILAVCGLVMFLTVPKANAFKVSVVGAADLPGAAVTPTTSFTVANHSFTLGGGVLFNFNMVRSFSMQLGALLLNRGYTQVSADGSAEEFTFISGQLPIVLRINLLSFLDIGIGGYASYGFGTVAPHWADDYGGLASVGIRIGFKALALVADGRYLYGLRNVSQLPDATVNLRDIEVLAGIQFGI